MLPSHLCRLHSITTRHCQEVLQSFCSRTVFSLSATRKLTNYKNNKAEQANDAPKTGSFAKDLFMGRLDMSLFQFPELSEEKLSELNQMVEPVRRYFSEAVDSKDIDASADIPDKILQDLKDLGLFGQQIPHEYGGLGLNTTECARLAEETAVDGSIAALLAAHQSAGLKGILLAGSDEQKAKYLPKLATGECIAAFCLTEPSSGSDLNSIQTTATLSEDGKMFYLNGVKIWVSNGGIADIFTVFAKTAIIINGKPKYKLTAFIVEKDFGGVECDDQQDKLGVRGLNTCNIHFNNTPVPIENVIGEVGDGFKLAIAIQESGRFSIGSSGAGLVKKVMGMTCEHATTRTQFDQKLSEFGLIQEKFAKMALTTYAMESMTYLTTGMMDKNPHLNMSIEAAIVKIFSSESCYSCVNECLQILGGLGYMKDYPYERFLRDTRFMILQQGSNEILRLYVALSGLQYAGQLEEEEIVKIRNPMKYPNTTKAYQLESVSLFGVNRKLWQVKWNPKICKIVHPSLKDAANTLEVSTVIFKKIVKGCLVLHAENILHEQITVKKVADAVISLYSMIACISRANRSINIGLKNADHEVLLATTLCKEAQWQIDRVHDEILVPKDPAERSIEAYEFIAENMVKNGGYAATHPLERMW